MYYDQKSKYNAILQERVPTVIIWICAKQMPIHFGILCRVSCPHIPDFVSERIGYEFVLGTFEHVVGHLRRLCVRIFGGIEALGREEAEVFSPKRTPQGRCMAPGFVGVSIHGAVDVIIVLHNYSQLTVMDPQL